MFEIKFGTIEFIPYLCNTEKKNKRNMKQFRIVMTCDEGYVADSLRYLANTCESYLNDEIEIDFETEHCCAEITEA